MNVECIEYGVLREGLYRPGNTQLWPDRHSFTTPPPPLPLKTLTLKHSENSFSVIVILFLSSSLPPDTLHNAMLVESPDEVNIFRFILKDKRWDPAMASPCSGTRM